MKSVLILLFSVFSVAVFAGEPIEYKSGSTAMEGYLALPAAKRLNSPAVLIVHDWMGLSDMVKKKADEMAEKGYVALAVDIYGKGVRPKDAKEAGALAGKYKNDVKLLRERMTAALKVLKNQRGVDPKHVVAFGYCFGGTSVLELARTGAEVAGIVSFHGGLATPKLTDAKNIKGKVLVLHGALDPFVPPAEVEAFQKAMNEAKVDYQFIAYSGAVHAFTNPSAGSDLKAGTAYNKRADERSWKAFEQFLAEVAPL
ncbi:MAG TPA: dienelactone hydrolase family protein [Pseudobdellovibrionaceae bacterium]|nr:dienelactone hydrolase family protein [Pseudobdellovibrionaceae bacterium]